MFVRVFFLLLLALNIGVGCWLYFAPAARSLDLPATDPGVPGLVLLSDLDKTGTAAGSAAMAAKPESAADRKKETCLSIGAFDTQADLRAAIEALTPLVARIQFRETRVIQIRGYWVYLPAPGNRERALDLARQLSSKGVSDYYVVTAGEQPNAISLGLFHERANADKRLDEIRALGFKPDLIQRSDEVPAYWIDFSQTGDTPLDWRSHVPAHGELHDVPIDCFPN